MNSKLLLVAGIALASACAQSGGTTTFPGIVQVCDKSIDCPTAGVATAAGELLVEGDVESDGNLNIAGTSTLTGNVTASGTLAVTGATTLTGALTANGGVTPSPVYTITFNEGASKGLMNMQSDGTAYDSTAAVLNYVYYGQYVLGANMIVDAGATVPAADAEGLDITAGNVTENDHVSYFGGILGASGRPFVVGTDAAFKFCATVKFHDVTGSDAFYCGFRSANPVTVAVASYTEYCSIGHISGNIGTQDQANGADDCGSDTWADDATKTICTLMSAAGVCTYTVEGAAPSSPGAETIADGTLVIPFCQLLHDADGADDTWLTSWAVTYQ